MSSQHSGNNYDNIISDNIWNNNHNFLAILNGFYYSMQHTVDLRRSIFIIFQDV